MMATLFLLSVADVGRAEGGQIVMSRVSPWFARRGSIATAMCSRFDFLDECQQDLVNAGAVYSLPIRCGREGQWNMCFVLLECFWS